MQFKTRKKKLQHVLTSVVRTFLIELNEKNKEIKISTESDFQCEQVYSMLENHFFKRKVDIQALRSTKNDRFWQKRSSSDQT